MGFTVSEGRSQTPIRRVIADRLGQSDREAIHVPVFRGVVVSRLVSEQPEGRQQGPRPSILDHTIVATAVALRAYPDFNAVFDDRQHKLVSEINIGIAVDTPKGLMVPVLRDIAAWDVLRVCEQRRALTEKVMSWEHSMADLADGTFTVSNLGPLQVDAFCPIINFSLNFDHRVVDGAAAARFLGVLAECLETGSPSRREKM